MTPFPFVGPSYTSQSPNVDSEVCMNWIVETIESPLAKTRYAMYPAPGFTGFTNLSYGPVRGMFAQDGRAFVVGGQKFYEVTSAGVVTERGTVVTDASPATICSNGLGGHQVFICSGGNGYIFDLNSNVFTQVLTGTAKMGAFLDGFFLALDVTTSTLQLSNLENGLVWSAADVAQRSSGGDKWVSMVVAHRQIYLFGSQTSEIWYNSGDPLFPFAPVDGGFFQQGISAPFSAAVFDNVVAWLGQNESGQGVIYRGNDGTFRDRISTHAVEFAIQKYSTLADPVAWTYQENGHGFYLLNFPSDNMTWGFDQSTGLWHQRGYWDPVNMTYVAMRPQYHMMAFGSHIVGDRLGGTLYTMRSAVATDISGAGMRRVRQVPFFTPTNTRVFHDRLQVDIESGLALVTGTGSDPKAVLTYSNDGGHTWSNEQWRSAGLIGQYGRRMIWNRLGSARGYARVYKLVCDDLIPWRISQAFLDVQPGTN